MSQSEWIIALAKGISERSTDLRFEMFGNQRVPLPPPDEQAAIVRFLDWATGRLDRAIRASPQIATATALVPVPGSSRGWRSRGFDVVDLALGREPPLPVAHCLTWDRRRRAQKSLTRSARVSNLVDALSCRVTVPQALIVDDVVTSGSTVTEAIRSIEAAGVSVVGIVGVAHAPPVGVAVGRAGATTGRPGV